MVIASSNDAGGEILKSLGIDPRLIKAFYIAGVVNEPLIVNIERFVYEEDVRPLDETIFQEYKLVRICD